MDILVSQMLFLMVDAVDESTVVGTTPVTGGYGAGAAKGEYLAAVTLKNDMRLMPLVDPAEGNFDGVVVRFGPLDNLGHSLVPSCHLTRPVERFFLAFDEKAWHP